MAGVNPDEPDIFTVNDVARAAGATMAEVRALLQSGDTSQRGARYLTFESAVELVRALRAPADGLVGERRLFAAPFHAVRQQGMPLAASGALHAATLAVLILLSGLGLRSAAPAPQPEPPRLVFLARPGPGGGGGGGGLRQPAPPARAELKGSRPRSSPVVVAPKPPRASEPDRAFERPPSVPTPVAPPPPPPMAAPEPAPAVVAPVASTPAEAADRAGTIDASPSVAASSGPGAEGGTGSGRGTGSGDGNGRGIGPGETAGIGGGPYRPGSGVSPPSLQHEVKPTYTEEGRRRGVEGDVVMEVVVRADGSVGSVRVVRGLGSGLDERAAAAVRQWRFTPARRLGAVVDVLVEVAVEFRLR